jgi:hypothetical protein
MQTTTKLSDLIVSNVSILVPEGTTVAVGSDDTALQQFKLENHGTVVFPNGIEGIGFSEVANHGLLRFEEGTSLETAKLGNHGEIMADGSLSITSTSDIEIVGSGRLTAAGTLTVSSEKSLSVKNGDFGAPELHFKSQTDININAGKIDGPVFLYAVNASCGSREGTLDIREQCLSGDPLYYCHSGDVTINHGISTDKQVVILAYGDITVNGNVHSDERIEMAAGVTFEITIGEGNYGGSDCDPDDPAEAWLDQHITGQAGPGKINVTGNLTCDENIALQAQGDIDVSGNITGGTVDIIIASRTGKITLPGDIEATKGDLHIAGRGEIDIEGEVKAKYLVSLVNDEEDKTISVKGNITSTHGGVSIINNGDLDLLDDGDEGAKIAANNGPVGLSSTGDLNVKGGIECKNNMSLANDKPNKKITVKGNMTSSSGLINVFNPGGEVALLDEEDSGAELKANKNVIIWSTSDYGKATINGKVTTEDGFVDINVEGPIEIIGDISTESDDPNFSSVFIRTPIDRASTTGGDTTIKTKKITAKGSNVVLRAGNTIQTKTIDVSKTDGSSFAGAIDISACLAEGTENEFTIGDTAPANGLGVEGQLIAHTDNGGNFDPDKFTGGVRVYTKGGGNIRVVSGSDISVTASQSRNGVIFLDADAEAGGKVILGGGTYSVDGTGSSAPGAILLLGEEISMDDDVILTSSYEGSENKNHYVTLSADKVNLGGDLTINGNGQQGLVELLPKGAVTLSSNMEPDLEWTTDRPNGVDGTDGELSIEGSGELKLSSNGSGCSVLVTGNPVTFQVTNDVTLSSTGPDVYHSVAITFSGETARDAGGVVFQTSGDVNVAVQGTDGGPGGAFLIDMSLVNVDTTNKITVNADGEDENGGLISWKAKNGNITVAEGKQLRFTANGGTSGAGGSIKFEATAFGPSITLRDTELSVNAGDGQGGNVNVLATDVGVITFESFKATANGADEGNGGVINVKGEALYLDQLTLEANAGSDGNGGPVTLEAVGDMQIFATEAPGLSQISSNGGTATGNGGGVFITGGDVWIANQMTTKCSALGAGTGGDIIITCNNDGTSLNLNEDGVVLEANGAGEDFGRGGDISLIVSAEEDGLLQGKLTAHADGKGTAQGGSITATANTVRFYMGELTCNAENEGSGGAVTFNADTLRLIETDVNVDGGEEGLGGQITAYPENDGEIELTAANLYVRGGESGGFGGSITIVADEVETNIIVDENSGLFAQSRGGDTKGGDITLQTLGTLAFRGEADASSSGIREGGNVNLSASELDTSSGLIVVNGGDEGGSGGIVDMQIDSDSDLLLGGVSATGYLEGGQISITNIANENLVVQIMGVVDTSAINSEDPNMPAGAFVLSVADSEANEVALRIQEGGGFKSTVNSEAKSISITAIADSLLGIDDVVANNGDITVCADGSGSCETSTLESSDSTANRRFDPSGSKVIIFGRAIAPNGGLILTCPKIETAAAVDEQIRLQSGADKPVEIRCDELSFGNNSFIHGASFASGDISISSLGNSGLKLVFKDNADQAGFKSAKNIFMYSTGDLTLQTGSPLDGTPRIAMECSNNCSLVADGSIVASGIIIGGLEFESGNIDATVTPTNLLISSFAGNVDLSFTTISAMSKISVTTDEGGGDVVVRTVACGNSTSPGEIFLSASNHIAIFGTVQTPGPIVAVAGNELFLDSDARLRALSGVAGLEKITLGAIGGVNISSGAQVRAHDEITVYSGAVVPSKANADSLATRPVTVILSQIHITYPGNLYWNNLTSLHVAGFSNSSDFTANGKDLTFDANFTDINIDEHVIFEAGA